MRLSDAIALGRGLVKLNAGSWHSGDTGCAICMAMAAIGKLDEWDEDRDSRFRLWPWLGNKASDSLPYIRSADKGKTISCYVGGLAFRVEEGEITIDQLIDIVRTIEPEECPERQASSVEAGLPAVELETK